MCGICRAEQKYMSFLRPSRSALSGKNPKKGTYTNDTTLCSGFSSENALDEGPAFWIFLGFTDKG